MSIFDFQGCEPPTGMASVGVSGWRFSFWTELLIFPNLDNYFGKFRHVQKAPIAWHYVLNLPLYHHQHTPIKYKLVPVIPAKIC